MIWGEVNGKAEKAMATPSSTLAWQIPGTGEPGGPPSMGSHRVGFSKPQSNWQNRGYSSYLTDEETGLREGVGMLCLSLQVLSFTPEACPRSALGLGDETWPYLVT